MIYNFVDQNICLSSSLLAILLLYYMGKSAILTFYQPNTSVFQVDQRNIVKI